MESDDWSVTVNNGGSLWLERPVTWVALWTETEEGSPWQRCKRISGRRRSQTGWWTGRLCGRGLRSAEGHSAGDTCNTGGKSHGGNQREEGSDTAGYTPRGVQNVRHTQCAVWILNGDVSFFKIFIFPLLLLSNYDLNAVSYPLLKTMQFHFNLHNVSRLIIHVLEW